MKKLGLFYHFGKNKLEEIRNRFTREKRKANPEIISLSDKWIVYNNNLLYNDLKVNKNQDKNTKNCLLSKKERYLL